MKSLQKAKRFPTNRNHNVAIIVLVMLLAVSVGFNRYQHTKLNRTVASSIPVLALSELLVGADYQLDSFQTVTLTRDGVTGDVYRVLIRGESLRGYNGYACLVVPKQLVHISEPDPNRPATAHVRMVFGEGTSAPVLFLQPQYLRPHYNTEGELMAVLPVE